MGFAIRCPLGRPRSSRIMKNISSSVINSFLEEPLFASASFSRADFRISHLP